MVLELGYGLDGPEFETQQSQEIFLFSRTSRLALEPSRPHIQGVSAFFPGGGGKITRGVMLTGNMHLAPRLRISGAILLCLHILDRDNFTFFYPKFVILKHAH